MKDWEVGWVITSIGRGIEPIGLTPHVAEPAAPGVAVYPRSSVHKAWEGGKGEVAGGGGGGGWVIG